MSLIEENSLETLKLSPEENISSLIDSIRRKSTEILAVQSVIQYKIQSQCSQPSFVEQSRKKVALALKNTMLTEERTNSNEKIAELVASIGEKSREISMHIARLNRRVDEQRDREKVFNLISSLKQNSQEIELVVKRIDEKKTPIKSEQALMVGEKKQEQSSAPLIAQFFKSIRVKEFLRNFLRFFQSIRLS
jgi:hypothetical protein